MSTLALVWIDSIHVGSSTAKALLRYLSTHNFYKPGFFFKNSTYMKALEISEKTLQRAFDHLEKNNFITIERRFDESGRQIPNGIYLLIPDEFIHSYEKMIDGEGVKFIEENSPVKMTTLGASKCGGPPRQNDDPYNIKRKNNKYNSKRKSKKPVIQEIEIPLWLTKQAWDEFKSHRVHIKKPMTLLSERKMLNKLQKLKDDGQNPIELLDRSIRNNWQDVFPEKPEQTNFKYTKQQLPTADQKYTICTNCKRPELYCECHIKLASRETSHAFLNEIKGKLKGNLINR
jgi:hypothetical protein